MQEAAVRMPIHRLIVMPWRWGRVPIISVVVIWLVFYVLSFPPVFMLLSWRTIEPPILHDAVVGLYLPLEYCAENSDAVFAFVKWEWEIVQHWPMISQFIPDPEPLSNAVPVGPGVNDAPTLAPLK